MSVGTLGIGANGAGQTIFQLTSGGSVQPRYISNQPSAECTSEPSQALGLQHDVEATPKGGAILNAENPNAVRSDTQLLVDATDNPGRCHDQGSAAGITAAPQGGLELIDVTDVGDPVEIGLTSHAGEAHTVNIDPKRPHIAYAVTSDAVSINAAGKRENEIPGDNDRLDLDGFEVVDMSSCMYFKAGTQPAGAAQPLPPAGLPLPLPRRQDRAGAHREEHDLRLSRARDLSRRPPHVRQRRRRDRARHERRVQRQRHAEELQGRSRQGPRRADAVPRA